MRTLCIDLGQNDNSNLLFIRHQSNLVLQQSVLYIVFVIRELTFRIDVFV